MKRSAKFFLMSLIVVMSLINVSFASDSASIAVSCTIPEVPGLNAPLIEEKTTRSQANSASKENKDTQESINLVKADSASAIVTTTYSR